MGANGINQQTYDLMKESFKRAPDNIAHAAKSAGVKWATAKRFYLGTGTRPFLPTQPPIKALLAEEHAQRVAQDLANVAALVADRERLAKEAEKARALEEEAATVDQAALRTLRKTTLGGLVALAGMTNGINKLAIRVGEQLANGVDSLGKPSHIDPATTIKILRDYSMTVGRLAQVVDVITSMKRVEQGLPTAIMGIDVSHITLEDAEREVEFAKNAITRAKELGLIVHDGGKTG